MLRVLYIVCSMFMYQHMQEAEVQEIVIHVR